MKKRRIKRLLALLLALCLTLPLAPLSAQAEDAAQVTQLPIEQLEDISMDLMNPDLRVEEPEPEYLDTDEVRVSIVLDKPSAVEAGYAPAAAGSYRQTLAADQAAVTQRINETLESDLDVVWNLTLAANLISAQVTYGQIEAIEAVKGVQAVYVERQYEPAVLPESSDVAYPTMVSAGEMSGVAGSWAEGYTGAGSRIAIIDTGIDEDHQSFDPGAFRYALEQNAKDKGLEPEEYVKSLNLLTARDIAMVLDQLNMKDRMPEGATATDLYRNEKLPFAFNYIDKNLEITHDHDGAGGHGSHVAGIASANRYIPKGEGYVEYTKDAGVVGTAPDAQLLVMKVFGKAGGAYDTDYMAAIEDAVMLGCDTVNLSLGSVMAGYTYSDEDYFNQIFKSLESTGVVVAIAVGNNSNFAAHSTSPTGLLYADDVNENQVGKPGSYTNSLAVASVDNISTTSIGATFGGVFMTVIEAVSGRNNSWTSLDTTPDASGTSYEYVFLGNPLDENDDKKYGSYEMDYVDTDVQGKIVLVSRGGAPFSQKLNTAQAMGAAALVIYNNEPGLFTASISPSTAKAPCVTISQEQMRTIFAHGQTGVVTVSGKINVEYLDAEYYTMSDFSSWGVPEDLSMKPEITAPGGNIYSVDGELPITNHYTTMSGTSMATPHLAGLSAGVMQYIRENNLTQRTGLSARVLAQSLLLSTAEPVIEEETKLPYSVRKQGAGLANVSNAISAPTYVLVDGQPDGKVKFELGDDPERTGCYTLKFQVSNLTERAQSYRLDTQILAPAVVEQDGVKYMGKTMHALEPTVTYAFESPLDFNGDSVLNRADAQALMAQIIRGEDIQNKEQADRNGDGLVNEYDVHCLLLEMQQNTVTVPANGTITITAQVTLSESDRQYIQSNFVNGTYVEGFLYLKAQEEADGAVGVSHSIPILGFYGNWTDASMFERGGQAKEVPQHGTCYSGDISNFLVRNSDGVLYYFGGNPYGVRDAVYLEERNAINPLSGDYIEAAAPSLIRNAAAVRVDWGSSVNWEETGALHLATVEDMVSSECYYAAMNGWVYTTHQMDIPDVGKQILDEGDSEKVYTIQVTASPEYYRAEDGSIHWEDLGRGSSWRVRFTTDSKAPELKNMRMEVNLITGQRMLYVTVQDNRYTAAVGILDRATDRYEVLEPVNQMSLGDETTISIDVTQLRGSEMVLMVGDYAANESFYQIEYEFGEKQKRYFRGVRDARYQWVSFDQEGSQVDGITDLNAAQGYYIPAAEYVDGYVYYIVDSPFFGDEIHRLYVRPENEYSDPVFIRNLEHGTYTQLSYNYADHKLYGIVPRSTIEVSGNSMLYSIDLQTGKEELVAELDRNIFAMCIDGNGQFYGIIPRASIYFTFSLDDIIDKKITCKTVGGGMLLDHGMPISPIGEQSMTYDHNTNKIYWASFSTSGLGNRLYEVSPYKNELQCVIENIGSITGLYVVTGKSGGGFQETNPTSIELSQTELTLKPAETFQLTASVYPWNASDRTVSWRSSDETVATVAPDGTVTALAEGTCTITAVSNLNPDLTASCAVTVAP